MTALIKSTDGTGWVGARVNDVVRIAGLLPQECVITEIRDNLIWFDSESLAWPVLPSDCQLVERPFRVGDDFEWIYHGMEYARNNVIDKPWHRCRVMSQIEADGMNEKENKHLYRHSSPLLRPVGGV